MDFLLFDSQIRIIFQLLLATFLGGLVGLEREYRRRPAGLRTYSLVCLGAALFTIISLEFFNNLPDKTRVNFDPSRVISAIIMGVGFIGAGLIIFRGSRVVGLTSAAVIWVVSAIGAAVGFRFYLVAFFTSFLTLIILIILRRLEKKLLINGKR